MAIAAPPAENAIARSDAGTNPPRRPTTRNVLAEARMIHRRRTLR
jgi:hypothetical protein